MTNPSLTSYHDIQLTPRGQIPVTPDLPPLPQYMSSIPFGADKNGRRINDIRGNVIRRVVLYMLECVETRNPGHPADAREEAKSRLIRQLNSHIPNPVYHVTFDYLLKEGNLYSYEFNAFLHHICNEISKNPYYFYNLGLGMLPESMRFFFSAISLRQVYLTMANIGSRFSSEQFDTKEDKENSIIIQRRTPVTQEQLGDTPWMIHVLSGCHTLRGALSTFPRVHSGLPYAEIEERKCIIHGNDCCEWQVNWQERKKQGLFGWLKQ